MKDFKMSEETRNQIMAGLEGLSPDQRGQILRGIACLSAEIEMASRKKVLEELRHEWADTMSTMFLIEPRSKR